MKKTLTLIVCSAILFLPTAGCGQPTPTQPIYTCPPAGNSAYTPLNAAGQSGTSYTDSPTGTSCYVASGILPASGSTPAQTGSWSNTAGPTEGGATGKVTLSLTCTATAGTTCTGVLWVFSRAAAVVATAPAVPTMGTPTTSKVEKPEPPRPGAVLAQNGLSVQLGYARK